MDTLGPLIMVSIGLVLLISTVVTLVKLQIKERDCRAARIRQRIIERDKLTHALDVYERQLTAMDKRALRNER